MQVRILLVISKMSYGGAQKMLSFLANNLKLAGYDVYIYTYAGDINDYQLEEGIVFLPEKNIHRNFILKRIIPILKVRKTINIVKPDIVISFLSNSNFLSVIGTAFKKIPLIISERSDPYNENNFLISIMRYFYKFAEGVVFQTEGAKRFYNKSIQRKSVVIPNPVTVKPNKSIPISKRNNEIAFVARFLIKQKRQDIIIKAMEKVRKKYKDIKLVFYGDGKDLEIIKSMVEELNLKDNVIFAGKVNNVQKYLQESKMFVLTSDYEGIPNALIEAMAVGLPVIATDCSPGGARLLIKNKLNGIIVPRGNPDEVANAILFLLDNPDIAEQLGTKAQEIINKYSPEKIIKQWIDYIECKIKSK